jgi:serine/threonine protein kinase/tetratricopeptide (TPR) repeat protein
LIIKKLTRTDAVDEPVANLESELDAFVAAFEGARARDVQTDLAAFLPKPGHTLYREILRELIRVDLEYGWTAGRPTSLEDYRTRFPELFENPEDLREIAFEEYRLRRQAGQDADPAEYQGRFGVATCDWPTQPPSRPGAEALSTPGLGSRSRRLLYPHNRYPSTPSKAARLGGAPVSMPDVGTEFLGFHLITELGRGAFGRVYLARQGELADRPVALKVARDLGGESRTLARLQHTNIVPIHSVHHAGPFHAVCMPFLGSTTLADVLRELRGHGGLPASGKVLVDTLQACQSATRPGGGSIAPLLARENNGAIAGALPPRGEPVAELSALGRLTYVEAVLWIGLRLASGLAHAHERGILHRDLKPANVLLADDGQPMLLDFNLSEDIKLRADAPPAFIGGTLPYMAPEHLLAIRQGAGTVDARGDLYALGVILYELLTGRYPFPTHTGPLESVLARMIEDRRQPPPKLRPYNPTVSPAVESIIRHCLEEEPGRRYQSARQLQEDLDRQLKNLPLRQAREVSLRERARKWVRRHPRLTSLTSAAVLATVLLAGLGILFVLRGERLSRLEAASSFAQFGEDMREARVLFLDAPTASKARLGEIAGACRQALARYHVLDNPQWQDQPAVQRLPSESREQLRADAGELLFLLAALSRLNAETESDPTRRREQLDRAVELNRLAEGCYPDGEAPAVRYQRAILVPRLGQRNETEQTLEKDPVPSARVSRDLCMLACAYTVQGRFHKALPLWERASVEDPQNVWVWYGLGSCYDSLGRPAQAAACYSACLALSPGYHGWYFRRGLAHLKSQEHELACADFDQTICQRPSLVEGYLDRALARLGLDRCKEALQDLARANELGAMDARICFIRAEVRERIGDTVGAARDREEGKRREPADEAGWVARGVARIGEAPEAALADFDRALRINPRFLPALESKAHVLSERLGRIEEAVRVLDQAVAISPESAPARAARAVLLARLGRREAALQDAREALSVDDSPATRYQVAGAYALTSTQASGDRLRALDLLTSALRQGFGHDLIGADRDLKPLQGDAHFRQLLEAVQTLERGTPGIAVKKGQAKTAAQSFE